jgi:hypothetical protein
MNYITVKQLYEKLNKQRPGLIGINSVYNIVKRKDFPSVRIGNKFLVIEKKNKAKKIRSTVFTVLLYALVILLGSE